MKKLSVAIAVFGLLVFGGGVKGACAKDNGKHNQLQIEKVQSDHIKLAEKKA
jgi:hypothetical protein